jgi:hypothetical protein
MGDALTADNIDIVWSRGNALRNNFEFDAIERVKEEKDQDPPAYPSNVAAKLKSIADDFTKLSNREPALDANEGLSADAQSPPTPAQSQAVDALVAAIKAHTKVVAPDAAELLDSVAKHAKGNTPAAERAKAFTARSVSNAALGILTAAARLTWTIVKGTTKAAVWAGGAITAATKIPAVVDFVVKYKHIISDVIGAVPGGRAVFEWIEMILRHWPI